MSLVSKELPVCQFLPTSSNFEQLCVFLRQSAALLQVQLPLISQIAWVGPLATPLIPLLFGVFKTKLH